MLLKVNNIFVHFFENLYIYYRSVTLDFKTLFLFLALFTHFYKHYNKPRFAKELCLKK